MARKKRVRKGGTVPNGKFEIKGSASDLYAPTCPICGTARLGVRMFDSGYGCVVHADCLAAYPTPAQTCSVCGNSKPKKMRVRDGDSAHIDCIKRRRKRVRDGKSSAKYEAPKVRTKTKKKGRKPRER